MTQCMNCNQSVTVGKVVCVECADLIEWQQARIAELEAEVQGLRANSTIQEQIIKNGSNPLDKDKIVGLVIEKSALQAQLREGMELLGLAETDLNIGNLCEKCCADCIDAGYDMGEPTFQCGCFKWRHADSYEALKKQ